MAVIRDAIGENKKIRVIGDYDIDGVCATYILVRSFRSLGAKADMAIPHLFPVQSVHFDQRPQSGMGGATHPLIVTCDNGIAAASQIELANGLGMQVVVTDHFRLFNSAAIGTAFLSSSSSQSF